jgi:hypothetical protein
MLVVGLFGHVKGFGVSGLRGGPAIKATAKPRSLDTAQPQRIHRETA